MSDNSRYRKEFNKPRYFAVDSATVIQVGDMVWLDTDDVKPAGDFTWDTSLAVTQRAFAKKFVGVAQDRSRSGDTTPIQVNMAGVHEMTCASATFELEDYVAPAKQSGNLLENQKVVKVTDPTLAIGKVATREPSAVTSVNLEIMAGKEPGNYNTPEEIRDALQTLSGSDMLSADYIKDGSTNHVFTAADDTKLTGIEALADVTDATNVAAAGAVMRTTHTNVDKEFIAEYTCVAGDDTAGYHDFDTGFGAAPEFVMFDILRAGVSVKADAIMTKLGGGDAGKVRIADGSATYVMTANDVVSLRCCNII